MRHIALGIMFTVACSGSTGRTGGTTQLDPPVGLYPPSEGAPGVGIDGEPLPTEVTQEETGTDGGGVVVSLDMGTLPDLGETPDASDDGCRDFKGNGKGHHYGLCPHKGKPNDHNTHDNNGNN